MTPRPLNRPCGVDVLAVMDEANSALRDGCVVEIELADMLHKAMDAVAELIEASQRTIAAFEALGNATGLAPTLSARVDCESALVAQKAALAAVEGQP